MSSWYLMLNGNVIGMIWGDEHARYVVAACNTPYSATPYTIGRVDAYGGYLPGHPPQPSQAPRKREQEQQP